MPPAANIDQAIQMAASDIAALSYGGVDSLFVQMGLWIDGMLSEATGIYKPSADPLPSSATLGQRRITDWYALQLQAKALIEGPGIGASGLIGTTAVINAVVRILYAVKDATAAGDGSTAGQQTAVVALYNLVWQ